MGGGVDLDGRWRILLKRLERRRRVIFRKSTAGQFIHFQGIDSSSGGPKTGVSWTVRRCIDGTFTAGGGTVTEDTGLGWYKYAMSAGDTAGNDIGFNFTGTGAIPQTVNIITTACDPTAPTNFGITAIPAVASGSAGALPTTGTGANQVQVDGSGGVTVGAAYRPGIRKNTALANFAVLMTDSTNHVPATGNAGSMSVTRAIDGGAFSAGTIGAVTEISSGWYVFNLGAGDLNGDIVMLRATASGCDDVDIEIRTCP